MKSITLQRNIINKDLKKSDICIAEKSDIPIWMDLMRLVIDGYPAMNEEEYLNELTRHVEEKHALVLKDGGILFGAMAFSDHPSCIDFFGIHPNTVRMFSIFK